MSHLIFYSFMQNKPNFLDDKMLVSSVVTKRYEQKQHLPAPAKQTQSKPIKPNFKRKKPLVIEFFFWYLKPNRICLNIKTGTVGNAHIRKGLNLLVLKEKLKGRFAKGL